MSRWVKLANFASGLEAEMIAERLRSEGVHAQTRGNDIVGIVGPGFQGPTARGVDVLVPDAELRQSRRLLEEIQTREPDDYDDSDDGV